MRVNRSTPAILTLARCSSVSVNPGPSMIHPRDTPAARAILAMLSKDGRALRGEDAADTLRGHSRLARDGGLLPSPLPNRLPKPHAPAGWVSDAGLRIAMPQPRLEQPGESVALRRP